VSGTKLAVRSTALAGAFVGVLTPSALADDGESGGAIAPDKPRIEQVLCDGAPSTTCSRGDELQVAGDDLADARALVFLGRAGRRDDRSAAPKRRNAHTLTVKVPRGARSGPVRVLSHTAGASAPGPRVLVRARAAALPAPATAPAPRVVEGDFAFPIRGTHDLGQSAANDFGGGRGHQGQDMFAACGTPVVAARGGTVEKAAFDSRAGNHVVITDEAGRSYVYMHMRKPAVVSKGDTVATGQPTGEVGQSGRASGCHLHFELWTSPGWYKGGKAIDPLPELRRWDQAA
jgi:murein DD-endopeptidase MepM/ murein hydrolase activator NlpD